MIPRKHLVVFGLLVVLAGRCHAADRPNVLEGKVIRIADGDTLTVLDAANVQHKIRLKGIDAPESSQAFGTRSRQALADRVFEKTIRVELTERDRYKRIPGKVYLNVRWINLEMVQEGWAWHYKRYSDDKRLAAAADEARKAKRGLWRDANPIPPWDFRAEKRSLVPEAIDRAMIQDAFESRRQSRAW